MKNLEYMIELIYGIIVLIDKIYRYNSNIYNKIHKNITCI